MYSISSVKLFYYITGNRLNKMYRWLPITSYVLVSWHECEPCNVSSFAPQWFLCTVFCCTSWNLSPPKALQLWFSSSLFWVFCCDRNLLGYLALSQPVNKTFLVLRAVNTKIGAFWNVDTMLCGRQEPVFWRYLLVSSLGYKKCSVLKMEGAGSTNIGIW